MSDWPLRKTLPVSTGATIFRQKAVSRNIYASVFLSFVLTWSYRKVSGGETGASIKGANLSIWSGEMIDKTKNKQIKTPKRVVRYLRQQTPPKTDRTKTEEPESPAVVFTDWASI